MKHVTRISAQTASRTTGAGHFDVLESADEQYFIRSAETGQLVGSRCTLDGATTYARGRAIVYDRDRPVLALAA